MSKRGYIQRYMLIIRLMRNNPFISLPELIRKVKDRPEIRPRLGISIVYLIKRSLIVEFIYVKFNNWVSRTRSVMPEKSRVGGLTASGI